jgi:hypothetical protein
MLGGESPPVEPDGGEALAKRKAVPPGPCVRKRGAKSRPDEQKSDMRQRRTDERAGDRESYIHQEPFCKSDGCATKTRPLSGSST